MFKKKLQFLTDVLEDNGMDTIPNNNVDVDEVLDFVFGPYKNVATRIYNILVSETGENPALLIQSENINSAEDFVNTLVPTLKKMGYSFAD